MASACPLSQLTRRGLFSFLAGSVAAAACAQNSARALRPEAFGAAGNGIRDDAAAFAAAFAAAAAQGLAVTLTPDARYRLGARGWRGLHAPSGLEIRGNGATILVRSPPNQGLPAGIGNALIRVDGGAAIIRNVNFDLGGFPVATLALRDCDVRIEDCTFVNGHLSNRSYGTFLVRCSGLIRGNRGRQVGHLFYCGHTDPGMKSHNLRIVNNQAQALAADFVVGTFSDSVIEENECDGMFAGVAISGYAGTGARSENILVTRNRFSNFRAQGIQTDIVGEITNRGLQVTNNELRAGGRTSAGIFMLRVDGFELTRNRIEDVQYGIVIDAAHNGLVRWNRIVAGPTQPVRAIGMVAAYGDIRSVRLLDNIAQGFPDGIILEGQRGRVRDVEIAGNELGGGTWGIRSTTGVSGVNVHNNVFRGNRSRDIQAGAGVTVGANRSGN